MNDRGDTEAGSVDSGPENRGKSEGCLLLEDGTPPWLQDVLAGLERDDNGPVRAFLALVFVLFYESGFYFTDGPRNSTPTFDLKVMKQLGGKSQRNTPQLLRYIKLRPDSKYEAEFSHILMEPKVLKIVLYKMPFEEMVIINLILSDLSIVNTHTFKLKSYIERTSTGRIKFIEFSCKKLSLEIKNILYSLKSSIELESYHPHHLLSLPPHVLRLLCKYVDAKSFVQFTQTCKYVYDNFSEDDTIWKYHSHVVYRGLNKTSTETWKDHFVYQTKKKNEATPFFASGYLGWPIFL